MIKVKRADLDAAIAKGDLEEYSIEPEGPTAKDAPTADTEEPASRAKTDGSSLSVEDEEELARELADVEAALRTGLDMDDQADPEPSETSVRRTLPTLNADQGSDMNRLLAETDNQMDDPDGATRRDAITHLRAAVAAKKADVALGAAEKDVHDNKAYRHDLAEVVKPRRPTPSSEKTERPADPRPAPLKLVAEQRIDAGPRQMQAPVRPRRVAAVALPDASSHVDKGFAEFASEMGATSLPDLLEAAAAYMAFVEGLDQFSRPQLMNTVRQADREDFSREEGLRSFGQLLRTGKLQKLEGGRFRASDDIGFQPDARAAG